MNETSMSQIRHRITLADLSKSGNLARVLCILIAAAVIGGLQPSVAASQALFIETKNARLRQQPAHWAGGVADLAYGDQVVELSRQGGWLRVRSADGKEGYLHESAVTSKTVVLKVSAESQARDVNASDIVLAGKGFSEDIEANYAAGMKNLDFSAVDAIEKTFLREGELERFLRDGGLNVSSN